MRPHNRAVNHPVFHIRLFGNMLKHPLPHPRLTPAHEAFIYAVPIPILGWQQPPLCSTSAHPFHRFHKTAAGLLVFAHIGIRVVSQEIPDFRPLIVG